MRPRLPIVSATTVTLSSPDRTGMPVRGSMMWLRRLPSAPAHGTLVVSRRNYGLIHNGQHAGKLSPAQRMTDADDPGRSVRLRAQRHDIAAKISERGRNAHAF